MKIKDVRSVLVKPKELSMKRCAEARKKGFHVYTEGGEYLWEYPWKTEKKTKDK